MPPLTAAFLLIVAAPISAQAATIRGVVLDHYTGRPLARTLVTLEMIQPNGVVKVPVRTGNNGQFVYLQLTAGAYLLSATRKNYAPAKYGQKFWNSAGTAILITEDSSPYIDLRLHRLGAITGSVWDENEIGIVDQEVYAYRPLRPPLLVARGKTDDRGMYRIAGLRPGSYVVRTGTKQLDEESSVLPTFYPNASSIDDARVIEVGLDQEAQDTNVRPNFGKTLTLSGETVGPQCDGRVTVTLFSELEQTSVSTLSFTFPELAPGSYELLAECTVSRVPYAVYQELQLERDRDRLSIQMGMVQPVQLVIEDQAGKPVDAQSVSVFARRKDLTGEGSPQRIRDGVVLLPGRWEFTASATGNFYPVSISSANTNNVERGRGDAWTEFLLPTRGRLTMKVTVATGAATVHGRVTKTLGDPAIGAPVYLEAFDPILNKRLVDLRKTLTGPRGEYRFTGLAPGTYRVVSSFEFEDPEERMMEAVHASVVLLEPGRDTAQDLELYTTP